ncbi:MAG: thrombospondin type 3 repeat-containing protein [Phycisphaerae bacterium]|nr:thrombospondin type 3 repeat-containing protein [Phycisphaerae bacterium]
MVPPIGGGANLLRLIPAPFNSNVLVYDELNLGLQAPAVACSALGAPEDDLDALEADTGDAIDPGRDGIPDGVSLFAYFSLDWNSITIMMPTDDPFPGMCTGSDAWAAGGDGVTPDDILISPPPALPIPLFAIFARGVMDIGLVPGDDIDALVLFDGLTPGVLDPGWEVALFSLAAGSPSLTGANPNMPPPPAAGYSPADVYWTRFQGPLGPIWLYASAAQQGLLPTDELNALDIGYAFPCQECPEEEWWCYQDYDLDGIPDLCDNCPDVGNPPEGAWWADPDFGEQVDTDGDGVGDACDSCPFHYNPEQDFVEGCCECFGDMDRSNNVDFYDLDLFVEALLTYPPDECADANEDHFVNGSDVQTFVNLILANGGAGTPCGSEPTGACCQEDLTCIDGTTESECDGPWYEGQLCADITCPPFTCIEPGQDCWVTACDGKTGYGFAQTPLPADFFGPGSDPFDGTVALGGPPYGGSGPFGSDTIVTRLERMCFIDPPPDSVDSTPLELTLLELVSCQPITVTYNGGLDPEDWDVAVSLPGPQDLGELTATKTHANGGTFDSYFFVQPLFTFTQVDPPHYTVSFNPGDAGYDPALLSSSGEPWLHTVTIGASCSPDFAPGYDIVGGDECCEEVCHAGPTPDHPHCVLPPYCETLCPKPPDNDDCEEAKAIGDVVDYAFDTTEATFDGGGTCMTSPNIWFCYSASCTGNLIVSLCGSSYDTKLAVYEGCTCDPLGTMLCCDDDTCGLQSECTVPVVDGGQYLIEVGGYGSNAGQGVMDIRCCLPPPNDDCDDAEVVNSPYPVTLIADLTCASVDCPGVLNWNAVWYDIELPYTSQNVQITVCPLNEDVASGGIILMDDCDCDDHIPADSSQWISCPNSLMGYEMVFSNRTGPGRIYYPVWAIGNSGDRMVLDITIDVIQLGCISPDNGTGTVDLPPVDCPYLSPDEVHQIIDGLPPGTTIELDPIHSWFFNVYRYPGGSLGGEVEEFESGLAMHLTGTGELEGFERYLDVDLNCVVHTGPRTPGDPVQSFPTEMYMMDGELEPGVSDPDFEYLTITAGSSFGLPSPGHTTLTELPTGDYAVDSFFDITYRIDFMGTPYGALAGYSGMTTATLRMEASGPPPPPKGACCVGYTCVATTTEGYCGTLGGTWYGGETCPQYSCPVK